MAKRLLGLRFEASKKVSRNLLSPLQAPASSLGSKKLFEPRRVIGRVKKMVEVMIYFPGSMQTTANAGEPPMTDSRVLNPELCSCSRTMAEQQEAFVKEVGTGVTMAVGDKVGGTAVGITVAVGVAVPTGTNVGVRVGIAVGVRVEIAVGMGV